MKNSATVSVIIPAYNYAEFLPMTIASVLAQGWKEEDVEMIVVDDGSTDGTQKMLQRFRHPSLRYLRQDNAGLAAARNRGLLEAQGEYVVFLDADDLLVPGYLRSQIACLEANPDADMAIAAHQQATSLHPHAFFRSIDSWPLCANRHEIHLYYNNIAPVHAFTLRRASIGSGRFFDAGLKACEDYDFWFKCQLDGLRFVSNAQALVLYRRHPDSMSANAARQSRHDCLLLDRVFLALSREREDERTHGKLAACIFGCLEAMRRILPFDRSKAEEIAASKLPLLLERAGSRTDSPDQRYAPIVRHYRNAAGNAARLPQLLRILSGDVMAALGKWHVSGIYPPGNASEEIFIRQRPLALRELNRRIADINRHNACPAPIHVLDALSGGCRLGLRKLKRLIPARSLIA
jgi:GT2 family glycosyltransferase